MDAVCCEGEALMNEPSKTGSNGGRDPLTGRFAPGNQIATGNPHAKRFHRIRTALLEAVTDEALVAMTKVQIEKALAGDTYAYKTILDVTVGKVGRDNDPVGRPMEIVVETATQAKFMYDRADRRDVGRATPTQVAHS